MNAAGYNILFIVLHFIYIFAYCARSNLVMNFVTVMFLILIFWIKLLVQLAKFPTEPAQLDSGHCLDTIAQVFSIYLGFNGTFVFFMYSYN
jgi:hypothetical protein